MAQHLLITAFKKGQFGLACAMGVVLAVMTLAVRRLSSSSSADCSADKDDDPR